MRGDPGILVYVLFAACAILAVAWALIRRLASRKLVAKLRPAFVGGAAGLFLGIVYVMSGIMTTLLLAIPIAVIAYFNMSGRRR